MALSSFREELAKGPVKTKYKDVSGNTIKQFDLIKYGDDQVEESELIVIWSPFENDYVGQHEEGFWLNAEAFNKAKITGSALEEKIIDKEDTFMHENSFPMADVHLIKEDQEEN